MDILFFIWITMRYNFLLYCDNIIFELKRVGGVSVYWAELLSRHNPNNALFFGYENNNIFAAALELDLKSEAYPSFIPCRYLPFWPSPHYASKGKHIFHSSYFRYSNNPNAINVTTVHDFTYEHYSHGIRKWVHSLQKKTTVKKSAGIICVSENTKQDLLNFYPWVNEDKIRVIYNGVGSEFYPVDEARVELYDRLQYSADNTFLLFVGDRSSYKNFAIYIELANQFLDFDLVVVGGKPFSEDEQERLSALGSRVKHFRGVPSDVLNLLYNAAFCLVYPSSYEGFGIPVLEAMRAGCPVISTNHASIPEVAGEAALLVDKVDVDSLAENVRLLFDETFRDQLKEKGFRQASQFSWDKCFAETYAFYQELWERSNNK